MLGVLLGGGTLLSASLYAWYRRRRAQPAPMEIQDEPEIVIDRVTDCTRFVELLQELRGEFGDIGEIRASIVNQCELVTIQWSNDRHIELWVSGPEYMRPLPRMRSREWDEGRPSLPVVLHVDSVREALRSIQAE